MNWPSRRTLSLCPVSTRCLLKMSAAKYCFVFVFAVFNAASCSGPAPLLKMNDGREVPGYGFGTWLGLTPSGGFAEVKDDSVEKAVESAIDAGYRHIDTASLYRTEDQVGRAIQKKIAEGVIKREDVFITTKLWNDQHPREKVVPALKQSLEQLSLDYVDLYLIHFPISLHANGSIDDTDYLDTWRGMIEARDQGLTKSIGVSNFNKDQLDRIISLTNVKPAMLQIELNLNLQQPELLSYCRQQDIRVTAYTPFGSLFPNKAAPDAPPPRVDEPALVSMANKYNKTVTQVNLRYLVELGAIPIPKSVTKSRIEQNLDVFDFELTDEEREVLRGYDRGYRNTVVKEWADSPYYPFEKE